MALTNAEKQARWRARNNAFAKIGRQVQQNGGGYVIKEADQPREAPAPRELTSAEQDQILNLVIRLLKTVDGPHEKKFHKYYVGNSHRGVLLPSCSHVGWKSGRFRIDSSLLTRIWAAIRTDVVCQINGSCQL
jgi:hypothetical protein